MPRPWKWTAAWWPRPYSGLTGQVPLRTGLDMVDQRSWVHVLSVISRCCVLEIDIWVLPALLQRLKGWGGQPISAQTIRCTLHQIGLHGCHPRRKPFLKMMHKKAWKQFAEDKQTKDMDYWNHVLWSDETKINLFGIDGVKRVWRQPGEEYKDKCVLPTVKHGGGSVMVWGCMRAAGTGEQQLIEWTMNNMYLAKTELLVFPATPTLHHDFTIQLGSSTITPSASVRNLGVIFDGQLTFKEHIAKTARSCRFALHNIRKIRPFLTEHAAQLLVQALVISRLDYCNALLAGLPSNIIKPLQMIQNAAARLVFNEPKRAHVTPLCVSLHWLPVAARIQFKTLMLAYRTTTGSAPTYVHSLLRIYIPSRSLRSESLRSQRGSKSLSRTFSFTVPGWWNDLPTPIRNAGSLSNFKQQLKTHLFQLYLTTLKK